MPIPSSGDVSLLYIQWEVFGKPFGASDPWDWLYNQGPSSQITGKSLGDCYLEANPSAGYPENFPVDITDFYGHKQYGDLWIQADGTYSGPTIYLYNSYNGDYITVSSGSFSETIYDRGDISINSFYLSKSGSDPYTQFDAGDGLRARVYFRARNDGAGSWSLYQDHDPYTALGNYLNYGYDLKYLISAAT